MDLFKYILDFGVGRPNSALFGWKKRLFDNEYLHLLEQGHSREKAKQLANKQVEIAEEQFQKNLEKEDRMYEQKQKAEKEKYTKKYMQQGYSKEKAIKMANHICELNIHSIFRKALKYYLGKGYSEKKSIEKAERSWRWMESENNYFPPSTEDLKIMAIRDD